MTLPYRIFSQGDAAITIDLGDSISESLNRKVLAMQAWLEAHAFNGLKDIVPAYSSLTLVYDPMTVKRLHRPPLTVAAWVKERLECAFRESGEGQDDERRIIELPVCYDETTGMDLLAMAHQKHITVEELVHLHCSVVYRVYMVGFLPGFPYLGEVPPVLAMPRKARPAPVLPGSVGIAGTQTGIYPLASPGGWNIIGRTPLKLFDPDTPQIVALKAGDRVRFFPISLEEFREKEAAMATHNQ